MEIFFIFLIGISIGSFINVVIIRLPKNLSVIRPRSFCSECNQPIKWYDNIPIISWLLLKGNCRNCNKSFSINYLLIEILFGLIFLYVHFHNQSIYEGLSVLQNNILSWIFVSILLPLLILDTKYLWLPSSIIYLGISTGIIFVSFYSYLMVSPIFLNNFFAGILGFITFKSLSSIGKLILKKPALGEGDIKLASLIGVWLGIKGLFVSLYLSFVSAGLFCLVLLNFKIIKRNSIIPFGPFMILSALGVWFYGTNFLLKYLN